MHFKIPKDDAKYHWTQHSGRKMMQYGLSADRVKRVIRAPRRMEAGVAPGTLAVMQPAGTSKKPWEVWVMYLEQKKGNKQHATSNMSRVAGHMSQKLIITAWKYPGTSPIRDVIPLPAGLLAELKREGLV
ncbi:MAG: hypothetical protein AAB667_01545 [Patescibacteria group bacterium]